MDGMKALGLVAGLAVGLAACGGSGGAAPDAGDGAADAPDDGRASDGPAGAASGFLAYDVTATLSITPDAGGGGAWSDFPTTVHFTVAWNPGTGDVFTGAGGDFSRTAAGASDGGAFESMGWQAAAPFPSGCGAVGHVALDQVTFSREGASLHGTAIGKVSYVTSGATSLQADATASLVGAPDATPPAFTVGAEASDPLAVHAFLASEPLPKDSSASLLSAPHGDVVPLGPMTVDHPDDPIKGFFEDVALRSGETYTLVTAGVADFAGHAPAAPVTFMTAPAPPLVPEDGFESLTGTMFAGAGVLHGGPLMPIAGETSLLLNTGFGGGFGFLPYDLGPSLAVRLALAPGDTVVRFSAQLIAPDPVDQAAFVGAIRYGSTGGTVGLANNVAGSGFAKVTLPSLGDVYISPVQTVSLPLPADAAGEIIFEIVGQTFSCDPPPSPTVLVVDDLRVE
jgi:hypothetical protein